MFLLTIALVGLLLCLFCLRRFNHWKRQGVAQYNWWVTLREILLSFIPYRSISEAIEKVYNDFPNERYFGLYQFAMPTLVIKDLDLIKQLTVKDFDHFVNHYLLVPDDTEPMWEKNLFCLKGDKWKDMRATLSPSFTSSKMKTMFELITDYSARFVEYFENQAGTVTVEMKDVFSRFTNDVIATTAFGISCDSLRNPNNDFYLMGKKLTNFAGFKTNITFLTFLLAPRLAKYMGLTIFSKKVSKFFSELVKENVRSREENGVVRPDMINLLIEARKERLSSTEEHAKQQLTEDDITAQALIFFFAGFDSVSTVMSFMAHELAVNVDVQERLQAEVDDISVECKRNITYDALSKMKYMDMVVSETLRKWPPGVVTDRVCVKPYTIEPTRDNEKSIQIKKGGTLWIPVFGLHRDPQYFPEPQRFDPERFNEENKSEISPYAYLPFGTGPRSCIGNRFALMELKLVFYYILTKFNLVVVDKTTVPLKVGRSAFQLTAAGGFWLGLKPRSLK